MSRDGAPALLVLCLVAVATAACSSPGGHRVLTFFFDGVPPLETSPGPGAAASAQGAVAAVPVRAREHGPYAAKLCDSCHETGRSNALVVPAEQLCARCHALDLGKKYVHGPLNAGGCVLCHDPHRSPYPNLLLSDSSVFCVRCHEPASLRPVEGHRSSAATCTQCHEAHMSDRPYLLR